jgi:hypothetical protein
MKTWKYRQRKKGEGRRRGKKLTDNLNKLSIFYRQVLAARPAGTNDYSHLELTGVEHPECNSKPS